MARKIQTILMVLGIGSATLFQAGGCDTAASTFMQGVQTGYTGVTGTNLFEDMGKELAGGVSGTTDEPVSNGSWGGVTPYSYSYSGFAPTYW